MQHFILLGFLQFRPLTVYDLKKAIERSVNFFYSSSSGGIVPALRKLTIEEMVTISREKEGGREKKYYHITDKGRRTFREWLISETAVSRIKDEMLLRLFFMGCIERKERTVLVRDYLFKIEERIRELEDLAQEFREKAKEIPEEFQEIADFQLETLMYGFDFYGFEREWFSSLQDRIIKKES